MEIISSKRFILLTLATSSLLTLNAFCADKLMIPNLHSKENYDKYVQPRGIPKGEKERSINFQELKDWRPKNVIKMSAATVNKMPHSAANLPLRFGRTTREEKCPATAANVEACILSPIPNLPQRFGRMTSAKSVTRTLSNLLQRSTHSLAACNVLYSRTCQRQDAQNPDGKWPRKYEIKEIDDTEGKQEK
uniref:Pro-FMRFamide-related neuropeptide VF n=1 Tax=Jaculus jaculus TaxID=51337 RepID=A0A8C5LDI2_JACJA